MNLLLVFISALSLVKAQNSAKTVLSSFLRECYSEPGLVNRNNLAPMSLTALLDIVRKIEDHPGVIGDMRQISTGIVHMFRQDGIIYDPTVAETEYVVPYSPTGFPAYKNRLLLTKLIPNNQFRLPDDALTPEEKCALHQMVSSSLYMHTRGDEELVCDWLVGSGARSASLRDYDKSQDVEVFDVKAAADIRGRQIMSTSRCPLETGVVTTRWGEVAMGPIITGIAAGLEEQNVLVTDLVTVRSGFTDSAGVVNNRYVSTISGDIAELAIRQGTTRNVLSMGASGGWNATDSRRHYFLNKNRDLEFTDAEVRGTIDGLALSELGAAYVDKFPELKLSQIIDMYYSDNGILHENRFRACNRKGMVPDMAARQTLIDRTVGPAIALYHVSQLSATTDLRGINTFVNNSVDAFLNYLPQNINDPVCNVTNDQIIRSKVNLLLIAEPTLARSQQIAYIVNEIDVGKFGSSITLIDAASGDVIVEQTFSIAKFFADFAKNMVAQSGSVNMLNVLRTLRSLATTRAISETAQHYCGGNATIALFMSDLIPLAGRERVEAILEANLLRNLAPDLRLVFASSSASEAVVNPLLHHYSDFLPVTLNALGTPSDSLFPVVNYFKAAPRRIVNPLCGHQWTNIDSGTVGFEDFVDADGVNLYRLSANYFYQNNPLRLVRIESTDYGSISVCYSRTNTFPRRNRTTSQVPDDVTCESASNSGIVEISLMNACAGAASIRECPALHLTVSSTTIPVTAQCKDFGCRYPNDIKYLVVAHELGCFSNASKITIPVAFIVIYTLIINKLIY